MLQWLTRSLVSLALTLTLTLRGVDLTPGEGVIEQQQYKVDYNNCTCSCICPGSAPECTTTTTTPPTTTTTSTTTSTTTTTPTTTTTTPTTTTTSTTTTTTDCDPVSPCDVLETGDFAELCEGNLAPEIVDQMKKDCEKREGDLDAIRDLFNNIEVVCAAKGVNVTLILTIIDCSTTSTTTSTTTTTTTTTPCPCNNVVFMVHGSNSTGLTNFDKEIAFLKLILTKLLYSSDCELRVALLSFSQTVSIKHKLTQPVNEQRLLDMADSLPFEASITNTHLAFDAAKSLFDSVQSEPCRNHIVLITDGMSTNWRATLQSMVNLYHFYDRVNTIVVAIKHPDVSDRQRSAEVRAMASGIGDHNVIEVNDFTQLDMNKANDVIDMIFVEPPEACSQWAITETSADGIGDYLHGVYEPENWPPCYGEKIFIHTRGEPNLGIRKLQTNIGTLVTWTLDANTPQTNCISAGTVAFMLTSGSTPQGFWLGKYNRIPVTVSCFH